MTSTATKKRVILELGSGNDLHGYDYTKASKTAGVIKRMVDTLGCPVGDTTIEEKLKLIPSALEARMK